MDSISTNRLQECEGHVANAFISMVRAGHALKEIKEHKLYLQANKESFSEYVYDRFKLSENYANRLICSSKIIEVLVSENTITEEQGWHLPEGAIRPMHKLLSQDKLHLVSDVYKTAKGLSKEDNLELPTGRMIAIACSHFVDINMEAYEGDISVKTTLSKEEYGKLKRILKGGKESDYIRRLIKNDLNKVTH